MKAIRQYTILNSEGPVMTFNRFTDHWSASFDGTRVHTIIEPIEMLEFLTGNGVISSDKKSYRYNDFPTDMRMNTVKLGLLLETLREEHNKLCISNKGYYDKHYKK